MMMVMVMMMMMMMIEDAAFGTALTFASCSPRTDTVLVKYKLIISRACETLYGAGDLKVVDLSANVLPFLVIHISYLISASWLPRIGSATRKMKAFRPRKNQVAKEKSSEWASSTLP